MFDTRWRKIIGDVLTRKTRTFLVAASIFVGVLGVIALFTTRDLINRQLREDVTLDRLSMIDVVVRAASDAVLDNDTYLATLNRQNEAGQAIPALDGIEVVEGQAFYPIDWSKPGSSELTTAELRSYSTPLQDVQIEPMRLVEGEWPQPGQKQVAVERRFADLNDFAIGDEIVFQALQNGSPAEETYTISGIVFHPYIYRGLTGEFPPPEVGVYAQYEDAQSLLEFNGFSKFIARYQTFALAQEHYDGFLNALIDVTPYVPVFPTYEDPADNVQVQDAGIFNDILSVLALVSMIVSGFLVINVISTIVFEQKRQIGAMKAIGANTPDNFVMYCGIAFVYGLIGTVLAVIPGILTGYGMTVYLAPRLDILIPGFRWSPPSVLIGVVMGLVVPVIAAAIPVVFGIRIRIIDAFTDLGISADYGLGPVSRIINALPMPITVRQAVANVYQKRVRLALTGITLLMTAATLMATIAVMIVLNRELDKIFSRLHYEFEYVPNQLQDPDTMHDLIMQEGDIKFVSPASIYYIQVEGDYYNFFTRNNLLQVFGIQPDGGVTTADYQEGTGWQDDPTREGIVITIPVSDQLNLHPGDDFNFRIGGQHVTREVIGVDRNGFDQSLMRWDDLAQLAGSVEGAPHPNEYTLLVFIQGRVLPVAAVGLDEALLTFLNADTDPDNPGVAVSGDLANAENLSVGDVLTLTVAGNTVERPIEAIIPNAVLEGAAQQAGLSQAEAIPSQIILFGFGDLVRITNVSLEGDPIPNGYYVAINSEDPSGDEVNAVIDKLNAHLLAAGISGRFTNRVAYQDALNEVIANNIAVILSATMLIAVVGAIGLLTTLSIAVLERQKEIGVMRSIGAGSGAVATQFLIEGLIVGFVSWVASIPVTYYFALMLFGVLQQKYIPFSYPVEALIIGLVAILVISALASLGPSLSAARKTVSDILRYQ